MPTTAIVGFGCTLSCSTDDVTFTPIAQLQRIKPSGSKQTLVDQTNVLTADPGALPLAVRVDSGDVEISGVLNPSNSSQLKLGQLHAQKTLAWWKVLLSDGVTVWSFQAFVSDFTPFDVTYNKFVPFTAKLRISGALNGPLGAV